MASVLASKGAVVPKSRQARLPDCPPPDKVAIGTSSSGVRMPPVVVQVQASNGQCWEADFSTPRLNTAKVFDGHAD